MKRLFRGIAALLIALIVCCCIVAAPIVKSGYDMYRRAVDREPIKDKAEEIMTGERYTPYEDISPQFTRELLHSEDRRFYYHMALDPIALARAVAVNIRYGRYVQGGSTITQQLAKNMYFSFEKDLSRKIAEFFVAHQLEKEYSKNEILAMYCAVVYFGENCYGVKEAAEYYYNTTPDKLNEEQSKELVQALKAPSVHNPRTN